MTPAVQVAALRAIDGAEDVARAACYITSWQEMRAMADRLRLEASMIETATRGQSARARTLRQCAAILGGE